MLEYASSLTTCRCCSATRFPMNLVNNETMAKIGAQNVAFGRKPTNISCNRQANPAAFEATERHAATGTGAHSYASGAQHWNADAGTCRGTPATAKPIAARARPE